MTTRFSTFLSAILAGLVALVPAPGFAEQDAGAKTLNLTLPTAIYAVPGVELSIYFDNVVLTQTPEAYRFEVKCDLGKTEARRWTVNASASDVGAHPLSITVVGLDGSRLSTASTTLRVVPGDAGAAREVRLLIVGDSLTHATIYPNEVARLLSKPGNPHWSMLGTHKPKQAAAGVAHEGYGGWTWSRFVSQYEPEPDGTYRKRSSPFVFLSANGKPQLDVAKYLTEQCGGQHPDFVIFMLGINDCFSALPDNREGIDARIDDVFKQADVLLQAFRKAAPKCEVGVCLTTPPNSREAAFQANYKDRYHRWGWKRVQHRLVQRQLQRFGNQNQAGVFLIPTQLNLDPVDGYPANNGVHPNAAGYQQIGASIYTWLKWRMADAGG